MYLFSINESKKIHSSKKRIPKEEFSAVIDSISLLDEAKKEADKIIEDAKNEAISIKENANKEGYNEGLEPFNKHIIYFEDQIKKLRMELQNTLLPILNKTCKRIVGEGLKQHPEIVLDIVTNVIKQVTSNHEIKLFVHKDDLNLVEEHKEDLKKLFDHLEIFQVEERGDVERGSCIIQTEKGILNANLENQYKALEKALLSSKSS